MKILLFFISLYSQLALGGTFQPMPAEQITDQSKLIVLGKVTDVNFHKNLDSDGKVFHAKVAITSILKGATKEKAFILPLHIGGLAGFDKRLEEGQHGVFFLESLKKNKASLVAWGAVALFDSKYISH